MVIEGSAAGEELCGAPGNVAGGDGGAWQELVASRARIAELEAELTEVRNRLNDRDAELREAREAVRCLQQQLVLETPWRPSEVLKAPATAGAVARLGGEVNVEPTGPRSGTLPPQGDDVAKEQEPHAATGPGCEIWKPSGGLAPLQEKQRIVRELQEQLAAELAKKQVQDKACLLVDDLKLKLVGVADTSVGGDMLNDPTATQKSGKCVVPKLPLAGLLGGSGGGGMEGGSRCGNAGVGGGGSGGACAPGCGWETPRSARARAAMLGCGPWAGSTLVTPGRRSHHELYDNGQSPSVLTGQLSARGRSGRSYTPLSQGGPCGASYERPTTPRVGGDRVYATKPY